MAQIAAGYTFTDDKEAAEAFNFHSATAHHAMIDSAVVSNVDEDDVLSSTRLYFVSESEPDLDASFWFQPSRGVLYHRTDGWSPYGKGYLTEAQNPILQGQVVESAGAPGLITGLSVDDPTRIIGVAAEAMASGATGIIMCGGVGAILCTIDSAVYTTDANIIVAGTFIGCPSSAGQAARGIAYDTVPASDPGYHLRLGYALATQDITSSGLVTCLILRG